ncbi:hypothetical protein BC477_09425 [Clavibacter michiganensis subsp. michiganensis]|uniref:Uncharacterized protein n=1 Tax=Clavibacter michiganensis subsp. michiganensis TaxID=33013 RepID=A0A251XN99_CLAMM|nr:hypothetical protein BC477_09425 [Clavibacter michiganensis subsp. michiganensis]OUE04945.1 hypothetical protein CMMCAS07_08345 [Clavibacter michiganensis subsp. michiganensis]
MYWSPRVQLAASSGKTWNMPRITGWPSSWASRITSRRYGRSRSRRCT